MSQSFRGCFPADGPCMARAGRRFVYHGDIEIEETSLLVVNPVVAGAPEVGEPTLTQTHGLAPSGDVAAGAPSLGSPTLTAVHSLAGDDAITQAPSLESPTLTQLHQLSGSGIATGAPDLAAPTITQTHNLALGSDVATGAPALGTPSMTYYAAAKLGTNSNTAEGASGAAATLTISITPTGGDLYLVTSGEAGGASSNTQPTAVTAGTNTFSKLDDATAGTTFWCGASMWWLQSAGTAALTATVTYPISGVEKVAIIAEVTGGGTPDVTATGAANSGNCQAELTTLQDSSLVLSGFAGGWGDDTGTPSLTFAGGHTKAVQESYTSSIAGLGSLTQGTAAATGTQTVSETSFNRGALILVSIPPA